MPSRVIETGKIIFIRYFWILIVLLSILLLLSGYLFFIKPRMDILEPGAALDVNTYEKVIVGERDYLNKLQKFKTEYNELDIKKLEKLNYVVGDEEDQAGLLLLVDAVTNQSPFEITSLEIKDIQKGSAVVALTLTGGSYQSFKQLLQTIENSIRIMDVINLQMTDAGTSCHLEIKSYFLE